MPQSWTTTSTQTYTNNDTKINFTVDGVEYTLGSKEMLRMKQLIQEKFPEDYL